MIFHRPFLYGIKTMKQFFFKIKLPDNSSIELFSENEDHLIEYSVCCLSQYGTKSWLKEKFVSLSEAYKSGFEYFIQNREKIVVETFENQVNITLLLIYLYMKPLDKEITKKIGEASKNHEYGRIFGPIGDYDVLDYLKSLGCLENISKRRSRWSEIILTNQGAIIAQKLEESWKVHSNFSLLDLL